MEVTMKAHVSTLTQPTNKSRSRTILVMIAGLVVVAAAIIGAVFALNQRMRAPGITSRTSAHRTLMAYCRVCADEALAARQLAAPNAEPATQPAAAGINARPLIASCRVCADEVLAARQPSVPASVRAAQPAPSILSTRPLIAQCQVCRDEALGSTSTDVGAAERSLALPASTELLRHDGPR
jgi:hypothetical protein